MCTLFLCDVSIRRLTFFCTMVVCMYMVLTPESGANKAFSHFDVAPASLHCLDLLAHAFTTVSADWAQGNHDRDAFACQQNSDKRNMPHIEARTSRNTAQRSRGAGRCGDCGHVQTATMHHPMMTSLLTPILGTFQYRPPYPHEVREGVGLALKLNRQNATRDCS